MRVCVYMYIIYACVCARALNDLHKNEEAQQSLERVLKVHSQIYMCACVCVHVYNICMFVCVCSMYVCVCVCMLCKKDEAQPN